VKADDFEAAKNNKDLMTHSSDVVWDQQDLQTKDPMEAKIHKLASPTFMTALNAAGNSLQGLEYFQEEIFPGLHPPLAT